MTDRSKRADQFRDNANAYRSMHPTETIDLTPEANPIDWRHWADYFEHIGMRFSARTMRTERSCSVPCVSPFNFDEPTAVRAVQAGDLRRSKIPKKLTFEERAAIVARLLPMRQRAAPKLRPQDIHETFDERMVRLKRETQDVLKTYRLPNEGKIHS